MSDTMTNVKLIHADDLQPDQLMVEDLIKVGEDIVEIISIDSDSTGDNYEVETQNEFGERETVTFSYTDSIPLYVFLDDDEDE